jgi:hypothetical protein
MANYAGFLQETEPELPANSSFTRSKVCSVFRRELEDESESVKVLFYVREHLVDLETKLLNGFWNNPKKSRLAGSSGLWQNMLFYLWARVFVLSTITSAS